MHQVGDPQGQAIDQHWPVGGGDGGSEVERHLARGPQGPAPRLVRGDARRHLGVARGGGRDIERGCAAGRDQALGIGALARARAAQYERDARARGQIRG
jgi:hypothetical protein